MQNNPIRYTDPSGHRLVEDEFGSGQIGSGGYPHGAPNKDDDPPRKPGEPLCDINLCKVVNRGLNAGVFILDGAGLWISGVEASIAGGVYAGAASACVLSQFLLCAPAFEFAFGIDVAVAGTLAPVENGVGYLSTTLTVFNDILSGNFGYDENIGVYVGNDSIVSFRNSALGSIPESLLDAAVSLSQFEYDIKRATGEKSGGYTPLFSIDFLTQLFLDDWW